MSAVVNMSRGFRFTLDEHNRHGESVVTLRLRIADRVFCSSFTVGRLGLASFSNYEWAWETLYTLARAEGYLP